MTTTTEKRAARKIDRARQFLDRAVFTLQSLVVLAMVYAVSHLDRLRLGEGGPECQGRSMADVLPAIPISLTTASERAIQTQLKELAVSGNATTGIKIKITAQSGGGKDIFTIPLDAEQARAMARQLQRRAEDPDFDGV